MGQVNLHLWVLLKGMIGTGFHFFRGSSPYYGARVTCPAFKQITQDWCIVQWLAAPDMICHIYSHLYCSLKGIEVVGNLPSSGEAAPTMGKVPCEFWADRQNLQFFRGSSSWQGSLAALPCPEWCIVSMAVGSRHDLAHWIFTPVGAPRGMVVGTCCLQGRQLLPWWNKYPGEFWADRPWVPFFRAPDHWDKWVLPALPCPGWSHCQCLAAPDVIWHIYSHLYLLLKVIVVGTCHLQTACCSSPNGAGPLVAVLPGSKSCQTSFSQSSSWLT